MSIIKEDDLLKTKDFPLYLSFDKEVWKMEDSEEMLETANAKTNKDTNNSNNTNTTNANTDSNTNLIQTNYILPKYYNDPKKQISNGTIITN